MLISFQRRLLRLLVAYYEQGDNYYARIPDLSDLNFDPNSYSGDQPVSRSVHRPDKVTLIQAPFVRYDLDPRTNISFYDGTTSPDVQISAFYQVLQGLEALHRIGFIYRDIKPANIGVVEEQEDNIEIVILDYGETIRAEKCEPSRGNTGTTPYVAPEMDESEYGNAVDIWAAGVVGVQIFVNEGELPWSDAVTEDREEWEIMMGLLENSDIDSVENLLLSMLAWSPESRPSATKAMEHSCFKEVRETLEKYEEPNLEGKRKRA